MNEAQAEKMLQEGVLSRAGDIFYALRFLKLLVTPWNQMKAFKYGIIDAKGKKLKKPELPAEKATYTMFHRLVFSIKRLLNAAGSGVANKIASYATALFLLKDSTNMSEDDIKDVMSKFLDQDWDQLPLVESRWFQNDRGQLNPGSYTLVRDIASPITGDLIGLAKSKVFVKEITDPYDIFLGFPIFEVIHKATGQKLYITNHDINR